MFDLVAARLPAAMRFPDMATGFIDCGDKHYGKQASGERLSASFIGIQGQNARVSVVYTAALPADAGAPFIPEEQSLLEAIATHMAAAVERHRIAAEEADRQALIDTVIAEAPDAIELVDMETLRFIEANATSCKLLGYTHEEMLSMRVTDTQATMDTEEKFAELRKTSQTTVEWSSKIVTGAKMARSSRFVSTSRQFGKKSATIWWRSGAILLLRRQSRQKYENCRWSLNKAPTPSSSPIWIAASSM
jgi:PAS domain-containing protein